MMSTPRTRSAFAAPLVGAALLACVAVAGGGAASANPFGAVFARVTGHAPLPAGALSEARCYGRYLAWRDVMAAAIRATDAWPASEGPVADFDRMQAAFVQTANAERGLSLNPASELDETALPADLRAALDRGSAEAKARLSAARGAPGAGSAGMAQAQSAMDGAFAPLRAPCARLLTDHPPHGPTLMMTQSDPPAAASVSFQVDTGSTNAAPSADPGAWTGSARIQVGVYDRASDADAAVGAAKLERTAEPRRRRAASVLPHAPALVHAAARRSPAARVPRFTLVSAQSAMDMDAGLRGRLTQ